MSKDRLALLDKTALMPSGGLKHVCFTAFCDSSPQKGAKINFLCFQREACPSSGRLHWQGYAQTAAREGLSIKNWQLQLSIGNSKIIACDGSSDDNIKYCSKEETRVPGTEFSKLGECRSISARSKKGSKRKAGESNSSACYAEAAQTASSASDYLRIVAEGDPRGFAKSFNNIKACANHLFPEEQFPPYVAPAGCNKGWVLPNDLKHWVEHEFIKTDRPKCLVLVGPSRLGKTQWARSLGRHMYWRGNTNVTKWDKDSKYLVFDDIEWKFIPQKKSLLTCMGMATVTDKYVGKRDILVDKVAIVLCNEFNVDSIEESEYWARNLCVVHVSEPLFDTAQLALAL